MHRLLAISAEEVYNQIESGQLSTTYIESSQNYDYIKDRVIHLQFLEQIFDSNDTIANLLNAVSLRYERNDFSEIQLPV